MAVNLKTTRGLHAAGVKMLVYGQAGAGKTSLIPTLPLPIVLSAEGGLLSIAEADVPYIEIQSMEDLRDAYAWLTQSEEGQAYESVALDSISEIAEVCLSTEKAKAKDPRQAYGEMQDQMGQIIRVFRDLPRHVYMTAKLERSQDETGKMLYAPAMPGNKTGQSLPYFFDEVFALRCIPGDDGSVQRALLCQSDGIWQAKDRSGKLSDWEPADLGAVVQKIGGE